ncbi:MAG: hypothetical protein ABR567_20180 [Myxococcales bacterium]|nr:hypothetical protein [Myxococcales bacterium]
MVPAAVSRRAAGGSLKKALFIVALLVVAFCAIPLPVPGGEKRQSWQVSGTGPLRAGAARVRIELPEHPILAGYAGHRRARDTSQPVYARAIAIEAGTARTFVASIDTLLIPPRFWKPDVCGMVAATHTHTGPGGLWDNLAAGWFGAGEPDETQRWAVKRALDEAVRQAEAALGPAELQMGRELWPQGPAQVRSGGPIDPELAAVRLRRPSGRTIATLVVYAMHPTSADHDVLSADWPGQLDDAGAPTIVLQGAVGNTTWPRTSSLAQPIAVKIEELLEDAPWLSEAPIECFASEVSAKPQASRRVPLGLRTAVTNLFGLAFEKTAVQARLRLGPVTLLGVPGEPVGELGLRARPNVVVGLAGGYLGYVETPDRWEAGGGESAKTYFGPGLAHTLGLWPQ